jgi:hypothetical protein
VKNIRCFLPIVILIVLLTGCSNDDCGPTSVVTPHPLAQMILEFSAGTNTASDSMNLSLSVGSSPLEQTIFDVRVTNTDESSRFTVSGASNPDFAAVAAVLTNGSDDQMRMGVSVVGGDNGYLTTNESTWLNGGLTGDYDPDLMGAEITSIIVHLDLIEIDSPGSDPNGNGQWTDFQLRILVVTLGRP